MSLHSFNEPRATLPDIFFLSVRGTTTKFRRYWQEKSAKFEWRSNCERIRIGLHHSQATYWVMVDGVLLSGANPSVTGAFRSLDAAMQAGVRKIRKGSPS